MRFEALPLAGCFLIEMERHADARGYFARTFCREEFMRHGLNPAVEQCNVSFNARRGTLRGMHYQASPHHEAKLVRCTRGALYDVILDLRRDSATFGKWHAVELRAGDGRMIYIAEGLAHGLQTLEDDTEVFYQMSESYRADGKRGVCWNDPAFAIRWPEADRIISDEDRALPCYGA